MKVNDPYLRQTAAFTIRFTFFQRYQTTTELLHSTFGSKMANGLQSPFGRGRRTCGAAGAAVAARDAAAGGCGSSSLAAVVRVFDG